jgi:hypothetical protein
MEVRELLALEEQRSSSGNLGWQSFEAFYSFELREESVLGAGH